MYGADASFFSDEESIRSELGGLLSSHDIRTVYFDCPITRRMNKKKQRVYGGQDPFLEATVQGRKGRLIICRQAKACFRYSGLAGWLSPRIFFSDEESIRSELGGLLSSHDMRTVYFDCPITRRMNKKKERSPGGQDPFLEATVQVRERRLILVKPHLFSLCGLDSVVTSLRFESFRP